MIYRFIRSAGFSLLLAGGTFTFIAGCDREEAKKAGDNAQTAAEKTGTVIDKGLHEAGADANRGIRNANDALRSAEPGLKAASTQASHELSVLSDKASIAAKRADEKVHEKLAPTTQP